MEIYKHLDIYLFEYLDTRMNTPERGDRGAFLAEESHLENF